MIIRFHDAMLDWIRRKESIFFLGDALGVDKTILNEDKLTNLIAKDSHYTKNFLNLTLASEHYEIKKGIDSLQHFVVEQFNKAQVVEFYKNMTEVPSIEVIFTTRYEESIENECNLIHRPFCILRTDEDLDDEETREFQLSVWHLCGSISYPSSLILTEEHFNEWHENNPYLFEKLAGLVTSKPLILIGFDYQSYKDCFFKTLYEKAFQEFAPEKKPSIYFIGKTCSTISENSIWAGINILKNHIKMKPAQFMKLLPRALGGEDYSTLRAARIPLGNVPDTSDFIGRENELQELKEVLDNYKLVIIEGLAGIGKSMLTARLAKLVRRRFEDRVAWISLNQGEDVPGQERRYVIFDSLLKQLAAFFLSQGDDSVEQIRTTKGAGLQSKFKGDGS